MNAARKRAAYGQNFLRHAAVARAIVGYANLEEGERVYDLGAGVGILTQEIARTGAHTIAVERDGNLARKLRARFADTRVIVIEGDLADIAFEPPFKIVANIPFNRTALVMKRLFFEGVWPESAVLLLQREAAEKYTTRLSTVSLRLKPWFEAQIVRAFAPSDFVPAPNAEAVLLRAAKRAQSLLSERERDQWDGFVCYAMARSKRDARRTFRNILSNLQWRLLARDLGIADGATLRDLTLLQWLGIYRFFVNRAPAHKRRLTATFWPIGR